MRRAWVVALVACGIAGTMLSGCGSDEPTAQEIAPEESPAAALDTDIEEAVEVIEACARYFEFDLKLSEVKASGDAKKKVKKELLVELKGLADEMASAAEEAYISGALPEKALQNANRITRNLARVKPKQGISGIKKKQMKRIEKSASRIERSCEASGDTLPQENLDARGGA